MQRPSRFKRQRKAGWQVARLREWNDHRLSGKFRKLERGIMADIWIGNVQDDTSDDEIREFLIKYGFPPFDAIRRVEGTGTRPAVVVTFHDTSPDALRNLQSRIHNMFWKNRTIVVQVMPERDDS
jgi:RNA recognition motif-containing protein